MSEPNNEEAAELAGRAAKQGKDAAKNAGRAARAVAEPVLDHVVDEAQDTVHKLEGTIDDAVSASRRFNPRVLSRISSNTGVGFIALSVSIAAATLAVTKFRGAFADRSQVISDAANTQ
jgi:hypothetical protein